LRLGKLAFARKCARCHNSKEADKLPADPQGQEKFLADVVLRDDFLDGNYLSDDKRYPVSELRTNAARAMGTNPLAGNIWEDFSSQTFKDQRDESGVVLQDADDQGQPTDLYDPLTGRRTIKFTVPDKRAPSYRTPTLVSVWATAPYLQYNSVGVFTNDPTVAGRIMAFDDGMRKLLWPELRLKERSIKVTTQDSRLPDLFALLQREHPELKGLAVDLNLIRIPKGTPVNLLMNLHPKDV